MALLKFTVEGYDLARVLAIFKDTDVPIHSLELMFMLLVLQDKLFVLLRHSGFSVSTESFLNFIYSC